MCSYRDELNEIKKILVEIGFESEKNEDIIRDTILIISNKKDPNNKKKLDEFLDQIHD